MLANHILKLIIFFIIKEPIPIYISSASASSSSLKSIRPKYGVSFIFVKGYIHFRMTMCMFSFSEKLCLLPNTRRRFNRFFNIIYIYFYIFPKVFLILTISDFTDPTRPSSSFSSSSTFSMTIFTRFSLFIMIHIISPSHTV